MTEQNDRELSKKQTQVSTAAAKPRERKSPKMPRPRLLPPWKVLLHNDDVNAMAKVVRVVCELTHLGKEEAIIRTLEADKSGVALLLVTHQERA